LAELEAEAATVQGRLATETSALNDALGRLEQLEYELATLHKEVTKKTDEIEAAHAQRDAANAEKAALQSFLTQEAGDEVTIVLPKQDSDLPEA
jgi:chromosome segregation ATPase